MKKRILFGYSLSGRTVVTSETMEQLTPDVEIIKDKTPRGSVIVGYKKEYRYGIADQLDLCRYTEAEFERKLYEGFKPWGLVWDWEQGIILDTDAIEELRKQVIEEAKDE